MTFRKIKENTKLTFVVEGRLDSTNSNELYQAVEGSLAGATELLFDFSNLTYISSSGLRVLLAAQQVMEEQGTISVTGCSDDILEIFELTGFTELMTIK